MTLIIVSMHNSPPRLDLENLFAYFCSLIYDLITAYITYISFSTLSLFHCFCSVVIVKSSVIHCLQICTDLITFSSGWGSVSTDGTDAV